MKKLITSLIVFSLFSCEARAQVPTANCNPPGILIQPSGQVYTCLAAPNTWTVVLTTRTFGNIANNTFIDVASITVPNSPSSAAIEFTINASLGAGGAVGQYEASSARTVLVNITRVQNLGLNATLTTTANATDANIPGATTISITTQLSAITGAANATQTFAVQLRIARGAGGSNNHTASILGRIVSPTLTNITVQ